MTVWPAEAFARLLDAFRHLEIEYMVGGSTASSIHGQTRMTRDIDIVARINLADTERFAGELRQDFYVDEHQIESAIHSHRSFNVIHLRTSFKFDIFPLARDPYQEAQFARRRLESSAAFGGLKFAVSSPEDVILSKLRWYRLGGEVSEQQWNDILGVIAVLQNRLDLAYLREWAGYLNVADLLEQALSERHEPL